MVSQFPVDKWHSLMKNPTTADAILDRLVHKSAVQLKFYQNTGRFHSKINEIPETPLHHLAMQLEADVSSI